MKTEEDEAFDDLARKQGDWGGGYQAKRKMAADKLQEPVAQGSKEHLKIMMEHSAWDDRLELSDALANIDEFYATTPPKREWVGLTDEEREQHRNDWHSNIHDKEFYAIEAKLKEKNFD